MTREDATEVLVVGAGPVGMMTALLLAEEGIDVRIIDKECRTAAHSYACVLHPGTLELLDKLDLGHDVLAHGRRIDTVAFYEGETRRAEVHLSELPGAFACAMVLPQSFFEDLLEQRLKEESGIKVLWNHRLSDLEFEDHAVVAAVDKLKQTAKGYIVADWDWTVQKRLKIRSDFVVGADGHDSLVRSRLGIDFERVAGPEQFAVFEFETESDPGNEVRVVVNDATTNVLWPLPGNRCRWSFQLLKAKEAGVFPAKERKSVRIMQEAADQHSRHYVQKLAQKRAPWFKGKIKDISWWSRIQFEHRLAKQFGKKRCWLAGDALHQTGPVGAQSMNAGLSEAADLAEKLRAILRDGASPDLLQRYQDVHRERWGKLIGARGGLGLGASASAWAKINSGKVLSCIPALGEDMARLAAQAGFNFVP
jgi:2-polyprenyl-6-methoxyphenol hydroxylase-like FAD-dependent oxidoreductase